MPSHKTADSGVSPVFYPVGIGGCFLRGKVGRGVKLTAYLHVMQKLGIYECLPSLPYTATRLVDLPFTYRYAHAYVGMITLIEM